MNCKRCDYTLWNIEARQCPECGLPFKPSDYEFSLNSVRFCCPQCRQAYYGTSNKGHLIPESFDCVACGKAITMDQMVLLPAIGVAESITRAELMPWIERAKIGRIAAWFQTLVKALSNPRRLIEITPRERPSSEAFLYGLSNLILFFLLNFSWFILPGVLLSAILPGTTLATIGRSTGIVFGVALMFGVITGYLFLQSAIAHLVISITGGSDQPFSRTLQCLAYSSGTSLLVAVPCIGVFGMPLCLIWWVVASAMMISTAHRISALRAALAASILPLLLTLLIAFAVFYRAKNPAPRVPKVGTGTSAVTVLGGSVLSPVEQAGVAKMSEALRKFVKDHGRFPAHGLELVEKGYLILTDFVLQGSLQDVVVAGRGLAQSITLTSEELKAWTEVAAAEMPVGIIAHRVGDFVYVYHGLSVSSRDAQDAAAQTGWVCVYVPVSAVGETAVAILLESGSILYTSAKELDATLRESENASRAARQSGLQAIRPLSGAGVLTHDQPYMKPEP